MKKFHWNLYKERDRKGSIIVIKRRKFCPRSKILWERYPRVEYEHLIHDHEELNKFIIRLNGRDLVEEEARRKWEIRSAYVSSEILKEFYQIIKTQTNEDEVEATKLFGYFRRYFLDFYLKFSDDPLQWHKMQNQWAMALLNVDDCPESNRIIKKGRLFSTRTIKTIVSMANKFMRLLHKKRPETIKELIFNPVTTANLRHIQSMRVMKKQVIVRHYISAHEWTIIEQNLPEDISSCVKLAYFYGLRIAETLGLFEQVENIRKDFLIIDRQAKKYSEEFLFVPLKGRELRKVPHWTVNPKMTYSLIQQIKPMSKTTLSKKIFKLMKKLKSQLSAHYTCHDLRHTWITNSVRNNNVRDVQLAAGHKDLTTTMGYLKDDRNLNDDIFIPD